MGKRISIYMSDEMFKSIQATAKKDGRSISNYLVQLHSREIYLLIKKSNINTEEQFNRECLGSKIIDDYIRARPAKNIGDKPAQPDKFESHRSEVAKKVSKDIKKRVKESTWINPLEGTACAPKN